MNDQGLQRGFKETVEWNKEINSRPGWESEQHGWEMQQAFWDAGKKINRNGTLNAGNYQLNKLKEKKTHSGNCHQEIR